MEKHCSCGNNYPSCDYCRESVCDCEYKIYGTNSEDKENKTTLEDDEKDQNW